MKMEIDEFQTRLRDAAVGDQAIVIIDDEQVVGHYLPVSHRDPDHVDIEGWAAARLEARARWIKRTPDWEERLSRFGLDDGGDPYGNEPRP